MLSMNGYMMKVLKPLVASTLRDWI